MFNLRFSYKTYVDVLSYYRVIWVTKIIQDVKIMIMTIETAEREEVIFRPIKNYNYD